MIKNIYEVLDEFKTATSKEERINILQKNNSMALRNFLVGTFHSNVKFTIKKPPEFKIEEVPPGMSYTHMGDAMEKAYLFQEGNYRTPTNLTEKRKEELLIQLLEGMEPREAELFSAMLTKSVKIPYLTPALVKEAFPGLLTE